MLQPGQSYFIYDDQGCIIFTIDHPAPTGMEDVLRQRGHKFTIGEKTETPVRFYVDKNKVMERVPIVAEWQGDTTIPADGVSTLNLVSTPKAKVFVEGDEAGKVDKDGRFTVAAVIPGTYDVRVELWPFLPTHLTFEAV